MVAEAAGRFKPSAASREGLVRVVMWLSAARAAG